jgi:MFS transporter, DHA2 family, multidrug resistance protein
VLIVRLLPPSKVVIGMAMFSVAATIGPGVGPTVGGILSDTVGWQAVFLLNLPAGIVMLVMLWFSLEREPMQLGLLRQGDWLGIATVTIGLGTLQTVLQEGEKHDWLESPFISRLAVIAAISLALFVWIELRTAQPLVNLRLLARRNVLGGALGSFVMGGACYALVFILPLYLSEVQGYNAAQIGGVMAWTGLTEFVATPFIPLLMRWMDGRWLMALGLILFATGNFMNVTITADTAGDQLVLPNIVRAVGQALVWTPLTTLAVVGIEPENTGSASALLNAMCSLGGAVGIALFQTFLMRRQHFHSSVIGQSVTWFDEPTRQNVNQLKRYFLDHGVTDDATALHKAMMVIADRVHLQASVMAFGDVFLLLAGLLIVGILAAVLLRKPPPMSVTMFH